MLSGISSCSQVHWHATQIPKPHTYSVLSSICRQQLPKNLNPTQVKPPPNWFHHCLIPSTLQKHHLSQGVLKLFLLKGFLPQYPQWENNRKWHPFSTSHHIHFPSAEMNGSTLNVASHKILYINLRDQSLEGNNKAFPSKSVFDYSSKKKQKQATALLSWKHKHTNKNLYKKPVLK